MRSPWLFPPFLNGCVHNDTSSQAVYTKYKQKSSKSFQNRIPLYPEVNRVGTFIYFTEEQKHQANEVDLAEFLQRQGESSSPLAGITGWIPTTV